MSDLEPLPGVHRSLRREIAAFEASRDDLPAGSHLRALFDITLDHLETCAAHLQRSIRTDLRPADARRARPHGEPEKPSRTTLSANR